MFFQYLRYRLSAKTGHGTHSPFVFQLLNSVIYNKHRYYAYTEIEEYRKQLLASTEQISCIDFGASAKGNHPIFKNIRIIAKRAVKPPKYGQLLFRLVNFYQSKNILEIGTSLGVTTCYLAAANTDNSVVSLDGCAEAVAIAKKNWTILGVENISVHTGNFNETLPRVLKDIDRLDFVFFDGNHRKDPTLNYFRQCLLKSHEGSVFVVDDIYWSAEMKEAWEVIKQHNQVTVTIDLFFMGLVFFHKGQVKQDFTILY